MNALIDFEVKFGPREEAAYEDIASYIQEAVVAAGVQHKVHVEMQAWAPYGQTTGIELTDFFAEQPGTGGGSKVMTLLVTLCDELRMATYLRPSSSRNREFYARFGFVDDNRNFGFLARYPKLDDDDDDFAPRKVDLTAGRDAKEQSSQPPQTAARGMRR